MEDNKSFEELEKDFTAIRDENRKCANTAFRIGSALLSLLALSKKTLLQNKEFSEVVTFLKGIVAKGMSYFKGIFNDGDITNTGNIMTNNLTVTGKATFFELEIQKAKAAGGMSVNSAGTFHIDAVEETETEDGYVCYQRAEKDGVVLLQTCEVKDQMMCSNGMNILKGGKGNHFYWRKVTKAPKEVVMHTIDGKEEKCLKIVLSKTDHSTNTVDIPQVGDDLVQMGNPDNKERQSIIMTCAYNSFDGDLKAPYWVQYDGVNDYKLSTHKRTWFAANGSQVTGNFKVQSDNGGLESIEDYVRGLATNTVVWHVAFSIRNITGKKGETFRLKYGRTVGENTTWYGDNPSYNGFDQLYVIIIDDATGNQQQAALGEDLNVADFYTGGSLTVHLMNNKTGEILAQDTIYPAAKPGKDGQDAVVFRLIPKVEKAVVRGAKREKAQVVLFLKYMITRQEGEKHYVELGRLDSFGLSLSIEPSGTSFEVKWEDGKPYWVIEDTCKYANRFDDTTFFRVCLMQGGKVLDARTIGLQYEVESNFNVGKRVDGIDGKIDGISGTVKTLDGRVSGFETKINGFRTEVRDKVSHSELKQTAEGIEMKVGSSVNANLLWGSDLDLSEVQDVMEKAYDLGNSIKKKTEEKAEWKRKRDNAGSDDDRMRFQDGMDVCDREIAQAQGGVAKCREAIAKHLGIVISGDMEIGNREMFQYLKGEGVGGSDAIRFKNAYKREDWAKWTNISWHDVPLKPNTTYTISVWVKFKSYGKKGRMYIDCASDDGRYCFGGYKYKEHYYDRTDIDKWQRVRYVFNSGASKKMSALNFCCIADEEGGAQCEIWLCRPKLEEGNTATPWCAYDGTVDALEQTGIFIKDKKIRLNARNTEVSGDLSVGSLRTMPKLVGDPFIEAHDGEFNIFTFERKKGIELSVDDSGMPHLIFYDKDGNPAYDLGWTGMKQLIDANVQDYWSADFLMKEDSYTDAVRISKITRDKCKEYYTYHAAYNRKTGFYGSNKEYNNVTFVEKNFNKQRIADGWYYPVNNGSLARIANERAYIYGTQKFQYRNGKMIGYENVFIEKDTENGPWRFSDYKSGGGRRGGGSRSRGSESSAPSQP